MDEFLTVPEVAAELKLNPQTIRNWIAQGKLPAQRLGRRVRIRKGDFEALVGGPLAGANAKSAAPSRKRDL